MSTQLCVKAIATFGTLGFGYYYAVASKNPKVQYIASLFVLSATIFACYGVW